MQSLLLLLLGVLSIMAVLGVASVGRAQEVDASDWQATSASVAAERLFVSGDGAVYALGRGALRHSGGYTPAPLVRTDDDGETWADVSLPAGMSLAAVDPIDGNVLFAVGVPGVFRSVDAGASWSLVLSATALTENSTSAAPARLVEVSPADHHIVYALVGRLYRSADGGTTWAVVARPAGVGTCDLDLTVVQADPIDARRVFSSAMCVGGHGSYAGQVAVSRDQAASWSIVGEFTTTRRDPVFRDYVWSFATSGAAAPDRVYALAYDRNSVGAYLYRSDDGGFTWTEVHEWRQTGPGGYGSAAIVADPTAADHVYAILRSDPGVFESWTGGQSWDSVGRTDVPRASALARSPDGRVLYLAGTDAVYRLILPPVNSSSDSASP